MYALVAYILVTTTVELINNPDATRAWEGFDETAQENVGNYYFVYAIPLIMTVCTTLLYRYKQWSLRLLLIALLIGQLFFLLYAQYTLSVIAAIIGVFTAMFANIRHTYSKAIVVVAGIFSVALLPSILQFAMEHVPSEQMATRLEELYAFFSSGDSSGYNLNGRLSLYGKTLEAFLNSPIWGNRYLPFDGHGTFLTVLGDLGLLGAVPLYYMYFRARTRVSFWIGEGGKQFWPVFLVLFLTGLFNPIHAALPIMLTAWFIVPLTLSLTSSDKGGEENA